MAEFEETTRFYSSTDAGGSRPILAKSGFLQSTDKSDTINNILSNRNLGLKTSETKYSSAQTSEVRTYGSGSVPRRVVVG